MVSLCDIFSVVYWRKLKLVEETVELKLVEQVVVFSVVIEGNPKLVE